MGTRQYRYNGVTYRDPRGTRQWRAIVETVVREEPVCWLGFPNVCTGASQTADHVLPVSVRPDLGLDRRNLRGACRACNQARNAKPVSTWRVAEDLDAAPPAPPAALGFLDVV